MNNVIRIFMCFVWTFLFMMFFAFVVGFIAVFFKVMLLEKFLDIWDIKYFSIIFIACFALAVLGTIKGKLPGTEKK